MEPLQAKVRRVLKDKISVVPYDPHWPESFEKEKAHLLGCLPRDLIRRIEHFGSTAVPGMPAKPIVDILVEVTDLEETKKQIAPVLEAQGYDYFWRPSFGDDTPPYYAWFIKRDADGNRTHHIHMVEGHFDHWDRLLFRDYLIEHPKDAREYADVKQKALKKHRADRAGYTQAKSDFIDRITKIAKEYYGQTS